MSITSASFEPFYLSPYSKLYQDIRFYLRIIGLPISPNHYQQTADPQTWFLAAEPIDPSVAKTQLTYYLRYLEGGGNLFDRAENIKVGRSFPYFEWRNGDSLMAVTDHLGQYQIILKDESMLTKEIISGVGSENLPIILILSGAGEKSLFNHHRNVYQLALDHQEYIEQINTLNRFRFSLISYFSSIVEGVLLSPSGRVVKLLTKQDLKEGLLFPVDLEQAD